MRPGEYIRLGEVVTKHSCGDDIPGIYGRYWRSVFQYNPYSFFNNCFYSRNSFIIPVFYWSEHEYEFDEIEGYENP